MNKIDDFFKNKYDAEQLADEGWNSPSDKLWEDVLPELPQKKPKRRFFLILLACTSLISLLILNYNTKRIGAFFTKENTENRLPINETESSDSFPVAILEGLNPNDKDVSTVGKKDEILEKVTPSNWLKDQKKLKVNRDINSKGNKRNYADSGELKTKTPIQKIINSNSIIIEKNNDVKSDKEKIVGLINSQRPSKVIEESYSNVQGKVFSKDFLLTEFINEEDTPVKFLKLVALPPIGFKKTGAIDLPIMPNLALNPNVIYNESYNFEMGIAHSLTFFSIFNFINPSEIDFDEGIELVNGRYRNINLSYQKWLTDRLSISSAFVYSAVDLYMCFDKDMLVDSTNIDFLISRELDNLAKRSNSDTEPGPSRVLLKDNVAVEEGETLLLNGKVDVSLQAFQIPLYFNYSFYSRKTEYFVGIGTSIDYVTLTERTENLKLFRDNVQISEDQMNLEYKETYFDQSFFFRTGLRRNISKHIKFGLDLKIDVLEPIYTSLDFGIYYRFNKSH